MEGCRSRVSMDGGGWRVRRPKTNSFAKRPSCAPYRQPVRLVTRSCYKVGMVPHRILIHISRSEHPGLPGRSSRPATDVREDARLRLRLRRGRFFRNEVLKKTWWTRTRRIRTTAAMPVEVAILEIKPPPVYQRIAPGARHLQELGLSVSEIGRRLGVDRWTVGKALRWLAEISSTRKA